MSSVSAWRRSSAVSGPVRGVDAVDAFGDPAHVYHLDAGARAEGGDHREARKLAEHREDAAWRIAMDVARAEDHLVVPILPSSRRLARGPGDVLKRPDTTPADLARP